MLDLVGTRVDRYDVISQLGQGGFGAVYRARHAVVGNEVALKVLWPDHADDPRKVERFVREARAAASLGHPNIVRVLDAGTTDGVTFLAMELLPGRDLESAIEARGPLPVRESVAILRQVLDALQAAHGRGIVHRDLKPANVFLVGDRDATQVRLLDFGISKMQHESKLTDSGMILGTPAFMAPEQVEGRADARADVFAAGAMLYAMLAGRPPFSGTGFEVLTRRMAGEREPPLGELVPGLPPWILAAVRRAMAPDPDARFSSATAMSEALEGRLDAAAGVATLPAHASMPPRVRPRRGAWIGVGLLAVLFSLGLGVLGVLGVALWRRAPEPEPAAEALSPVAAEPVPDVIPVVPVSVPAPTLSGDTATLAEDEVAPPETRSERLRPGNPRGVAYTFVRFVSRAPRSTLLAALNRARPAVSACHRGRRDAVSVSLVATLGGEISIAQPHATRHSSDLGVARCVAEAIRGAGPLRLGPQQTVIADLDVVVPAP
ncbi:MAG: serine/threonine protein kinase [Sandaracinaceae bacterium]|nr:MAG: serine/threonine protein kinase [Sandaracinaceae bacterium]